MIAKLFKEQHWHVLILMILLFFIYFLTRIDGSMLEGELWGMSTLYWLTLAIASPIIHQLYVLVC